MMDISSPRDRQLTSMRKYFLNKKQESKLIEAVAEADDGLTSLNVSTETDEIDERIRRQREEQMTRWKQKVLHGRYYRELHENEDNDKETSSRWLRTVSLFPETEGFMAAMVEDKYRRCRSSGETIQHILNGCTQLAPEEYKKRHDDVGKILHLEMERINMGKE